MSDDIVARLRQLADAMSEARFPALEATAVEAAAEIERLRAERDETRRRYCFAMAEHGEETEAHQTATDEGWDCFKEVK